MSPMGIGLLCVAALLALLVARVPIGLALSAVSFVGIASIRGFDAAIGALASIPYDFAAHWTLSAVPMFLLMGTIAAHSGLTKGLFEAMRAWLSRLPGGLAIATNFAGAGFAAASGSSLATTAAMGRIAVPEMLRLGYNPGLATGVAAAVGTLGAVIPPSILIVLFAVFAQVPVGQVLIAGILPGLLTAAGYAAMIIIRCKLQPSLAPRIDEAVSWSERFHLLLQIWPVPLLILSVIGSIYTGLATATEAGALGAVSAGLIAFAQRRLSWTVLRDSVVEATISTGMIFFIAIGASLFTRFLAFTGIPFELAGFVTEIDASALAVVVMTGLVYLVLGMFLDPLGIMLLTLPILLPIFNALNIDLIWMGILLVKYMEIGMLTPPVGLNVFIMKSAVGDAVTISTIFKGVSWFLLAEVFIIGALILFPDITLILPRMMAS